MPAFMNLFKARADWPISPAQTPTVKVYKAEVPPRVTAIPKLWFDPNYRTLDPLKRNAHGDHTAPFAKKEGEEGAEDWNSDRLGNQQRNHNHYPQNP